MSEEQTLIKTFIAGNNYAFSLIYKRYVNELFAYGLALGFNRETVKDAVQEVFYKLHENKKHLGKLDSLKYYLLKMMKNHLVDIYRSEIETSNIDSYELSFSIKTTVLDELITKEEQTQLQAKIDSLLSLLTNRQREAVYLRFIQEMEYEEIGKLLDLTPHASRKLVSRAVKRMREEASIAILITVLCMIKF
ncbi:MAG: sigma-70 family RNA polymerase sigma factor [Tannerella sp.]|jgi:RNA polymerase sigma factor (sigma-70 family)|nr:sigma-70 family RNA polymerase sigma factor [Tannerella sp.]